MSEFHIRSLDYLVDEVFEHEVVRFNNFKGSQLKKTIDFYLRPFLNVDSSSQLYYAIERLLEKFISEFPTGTRYFISIKSHMLNQKRRSQLLVKDSLFPLIDSNAIQHLSDLAMLNNDTFIDSFTMKITIFHEN